MIALSLANAFCLVEERDDLGRAKVGPDAEAGHAAEAAHAHGSCFPRACMNRG